jgi:hypothetical protein
MVQLFEIVKDGYYFNRNLKLELCHCFSSPSRVIAHEAFRRGRAVWSRYDRAERAEGCNGGLHHAGAPIYLPEGG